MTFVRRTVRHLVCILALPIAMTACATASPSFDRTIQPVNQAEPSLSANAKAKQQTQQKGPNSIRIRAQVQSPNDQPKAGDGLNKPQADSPVTSMTRFEKLSAWTTSIGIIVGAIVAGIYYGQLQEMKQANALAINQLLMTDRPWLKAEAQIVGPYRFDGDKRTISLSVKIVATNVGRSPAVNATYAVWLQPHAGDSRTAIEIWRTGCQSMKNQTVDSGLTIFPNDSHEFQTHVSTGFPETFPGFPPDSNFDLSLSWCVDYRLNGSTDHHQTGSSQTIWWPDPAKGSNVGRTFGPQIKEAPANELVLSPNPLATPFAN